MKAASSLCVLVALCCMPVRAQPMAATRMLDGAAELRWPACEPVSWQRGALTSALQIELQTVGRPERSGVWRLAIDGDCADVDSAPTLRAATSERALERTLSLADVPSPLRPRALALALAELLRAALAPSSPVVAAPRALQPTAADASPETALALRPGLRVFFAHRDVMFGAELTLQLQRWTLGVAGLVGVYADPIGSARVGVIEALLGYRLLATRSGAFSFTAGPRIAAGASFGSAISAADAMMSSATVLAWDAGAELGLDADVGAGISLGLHAVGGYAGGGRFVADSRLLAQTAGLFVGAALSVAASWN